MMAAKSNSFPVQSAVLAISICQLALCLELASQMEPMKIQMADMESLQCLRGEPMNVSTKSFKAIEKRLKIVGMMAMDHAWLPQEFLRVLFPMDNIVTFSKREWEIMALDARVMVKNIEGYLF